MPGTDEILYILVSFMLKYILEGEYYPAFKNEGTEEKRGQVTCSELPGGTGLESGLFKNSPSLCIMNNWNIKLLPGESSISQGLENSLEGGKKEERE